MRQPTHFKYRMEDVECKFCTEFNKKQGGCTRKICPWLAERIEAGAVGYGEALLDSFPHDPNLEARLRTAVRLFHGSLWLNEGHRQRMEALKAREGYRRRRDTPAYFAAMYLLTADRDTAKRTENCFCRDGIMFGYATTKGISPHGYTLLSAARDIYANGDGVALADLANGEVIDTEAFCLIVNALLIARYGSAALELQQCVKADDGPTT